MVIHQGGRARQANTTSEKVLVLATEGSRQRPIAETLRSVAVHTPPSPPPHSQVAWSDVHI